MLKSNISDLFGGHQKEKSSRYPTLDGIGNYIYTAFVGLYQFNN